MQRRMGPKPDPTRRAGAIRGAWRRCTLVAGAGHAPRVRLARHRDSRRRGPGFLPLTLLDFALDSHLSIGQNIQARNEQFCNPACPFNGTSSLYASNGGSAVTLSKSGGGTFDLLRFDGAGAVNLHEWGPGWPVTRNIEVLGTVMGGDARTRHLRIEVRWIGLCRPGLAPTMPVAPAAPLQWRTAHPPQSGGCMSQIKPEPAQPTQTSPTKPRSSANQRNTGSVPGSTGTKLTGRPAQAICCCSRISKSPVQSKTLQKCSRTRACG